MTDTVKRQNRRAVIYRWLLFGGAVLLVMLLAATGTLAAVQTLRVDSLRAAIVTQRTQLANSTGSAASQYEDLSKQYAALFAACQKSTTCLASAPPQEAPVIIQGAQGQPGRSVTTADIDAAILSYCADHNACIGTTGVAGAPGAAGATGSNGLDGTAGAPGASGLDGRGIATIACVLEPDGTTTAFRFTFTDATVADVVGACTPPLVVITPQLKASTP
jgi:hypothetical protein